MGTEATIASKRMPLEVILVGIGNVKAAQNFSNDLDLDKSEWVTLLVDKDGNLTDTLGRDKGWLTIDKAHALLWEVLLCFEIANAPTSISTKASDLAGIQEVLQCCFKCKLARPILNRLTCSKAFIIEIGVA